MEASEGARAVYAKGLGQEGLDKAIMAIAEGVGARAEITRHVSHPRRPAGLTRHLPTLSPSDCYARLGWTVSEAQQRHGRTQDKEKRECQRGRKSQSP